METILSSAKVAAAASPSVSSGSRLFAASPARASAPHRVSMASRSRRAAPVVVRCVKNEKLEVPEMECFGVRVRRSNRLSDGTKKEQLVPRNMLEEIFWSKEDEIAQRKEKIPIETLVKAVENAPPVRDFVGALKAAYERNNLPALIAEVKKASPSRGVLRENFDPVEIATTYEKNGAACLSVITDEKYFQGSYENLAAVRKSGVKCPLLCKELIIDAWQIYYARSIGADAILLIAGALTDDEIKSLMKTAKDLGLAVLMEVHDEAETERVMNIDGIQLLGVNNRDLGTFKIDINNTKNMLEGRMDLLQQRGIMIVGESGLFTPDHIQHMKDLGVGAVLVGESLVVQEDPGQAISGLFGRELDA